MKKIKLKSLIIAFVAALTCCGLFAVITADKVTTSITASAASSIVGHYDNKLKNQSNFVTIDSIVGGKKVVYLYPNNNGVNNIGDYFSYYNTENHSDDNKSSNNELIHNAHGTGRPTAGSPNNGQFSSIINLSKNISIAMSAGYVFVDASAYYSSGDLSELDVTDEVASYLYVYNSNDGNITPALSSKDFEKRENYNSESDKYSFDASELKQLFDTVEFSFKSKLVVGWGGYYNYMKVKEPTVNFTTTDLDVPVLSIDYDMAWAQSRDVKINVTDSKSGLQRVEYKLGNGNWQTLESYEDYQTSKELTLTITQNQEVSFRAIDNIGNVSSVVSYDEEHIDTTAPSASLSFSRSEFDLEFDFTANLKSNHSNFVSPENYYYTYKIGDGIESKPISLVNGLNHFKTNEVGEFTFIVYAEDEAGNKFSTEYLLVFKKKIEIASVTETYTYNGQNQFEFDNPTINGEIVSEDELAKVGFGFIITQNGLDADFVNVGSYDYKFVTTNNYYVVSKTGSAVIDAYNLNLTVDESDNIVQYNRNSHSLIYLLDVDVDVNLTYFDSNNNEISEPSEVGNYTVKLEYVADSNYYLSEICSLVITKRDLLVKANAKSITYGEDIDDFSYNVDGMLDGDSFEFTLVCDYTLDAGTYIITFAQKSGLNFEEEQYLLNYNVIFEDAEFVINKLNVYVTPESEQSKMFMEAEPEYKYSVSGLINGDELIGEIGREPGENVGFYSFNAGTLYNKNYNVVVDDISFQITKRMAYIIINDASKIYGDADPIFTFNEEISNVLPDDIEFIKSKINYGDNKNVGTYTLTINKSDVKNYVVVLLEAEMTILKRDVTIAADNIVAEFGEEKALTYVCDNMVEGDSFTGNLIREDGNEIGKIYVISQGDLDNANYNINFVSGTYTIVKKQITITAHNSSKVYGEADKLSYSVSGNLDLDVTLVRELGENVGKFQIYDFIFDGMENYDVTFVPAELSIEKAEIFVTILDGNKEYNTNDPEFKYIIDGIKFDDEINLNIVREAGENVGSYVISLGENDLTNYIIANNPKATFEIVKANIKLQLSDKTVTYNGKNINIDEIETDLPLTYVYTMYGSPIASDSIIDAGEYSVIAIFEGNENYNATESNIAQLLVEKKLIPITLKQSAFNYDGNAKKPIYDINLDEKVNVQVNFVSGIIDPSDVGEYDFEIVSMEVNYTCTFTGTLVIYENFLMNSSNGSAQLVSDVVGISSLGIRIIEQSNSSLKSAFSGLRDGRKCLSVYSFENVSDNVANGEVFTVRIKAGSESDVKIYSVDANGNMTELSYSLSGGYYVLSVNDISSSILVTASDKTMFIAKVISTILVISLCYIITKAVRRQNKNHFYKRNTTISYVDYEELKTTEVIENRSYNAEVISGNDFINY